MTRPRGVQSGLLGSELLDQALRDGRVPVGPAELRIPFAADHRDIVAVQPDHRGVERAAVQVVGQDVPSARPAVPAVTG